MAVGIQRLHWRTTCTSVLMAIHIQRPLIGGYSVPQICVSFVCFQKWYTWHCQTNQNLNGFQSKLSTNYKGKRFGLKFELGSTWFWYFAPHSNPELDLWSGSVQLSNPGLDFGLVPISSGSNFGSELDCGIPRYWGSGNLGGFGNLNYSAWRIQKNTRWSGETRRWHSLKERDDDRGKWGSKQVFK